MQLLRTLNHLAAHFPRGAVVTIGNYDGVHLGHQAILQKLIAKAHELNLPAVVVIFEPQPEEYFNPQTEVARLSSLREKLTYFRNHGVANVLCLRFNGRLAAMSADEFIQQILLDALRVRYLIVGDDFGFGHRRSGNFTLLQQYAKQHHFMVEQMLPFRINGVRVSSTLVRTALQVGDLAIAQELLGHPYTLMGRVVHGEKVGRSLGFPTANVYLPHKVFPVSGVYIVKIHGLAAHYYQGVANIGVRPTVGSTQRLLEVYIFDFNENIYGKKIEVEFLRKIRDEKKFTSFELLQQQIAIDVRMAKDYFSL